MRKKRVKTKKPENIFARLDEAASKYRRGSGRRLFDIKKLIPFNRFELESLLAKAKCQRDKVLFCMLYLTAGRINEILKLTKGQLKIEQKHGRDFLVIYNVVTLKRHDNMLRRVDILIDKERAYVEPILGFIAHLKDEEPLFYIKRARAWQIIHSFGTFPHFLRHTRLTHLVQDYGFGGYELQKFTGWRRLATGENYVSLYGDYLAEKMAKA